MAIGIVVATPAQAHSPVVSKPKTIERTPEAAKKHAKVLMASYGWHSEKEWQCLINLWTKESNWRPNAHNKQLVKVKIDGKWVYVQAGGIPQILGLDPKTPVEKQILLGMQYITNRYGTPCKAWQFWSSGKGWY